MFGAPEYNQKKKRSSYPQLSIMCVYLNTPEVVVREASEKLPRIDLVS